MSASVVLVHGAWFGPQCWSDVIEGLADRGVEACATELHRGSVLADIEAVEADLERRVHHGGVVLCGHSYGGRVISGVGGTRVAHLAYLAASMPEPGETVSSSPPTPELRSAMVMREDGTCDLDPRAAEELMFHDCPPEVAARAIGQLRPQVAAVFGQDIPRASWKTVPSTYVVCTEDRAIDPGGQRRLARRATRGIEWTSGHCPFLSRPSEVVTLLADIVSEVANASG